MRLELSRPVRSCAGLLPAGHRGRLRPVESWSLYDVHAELPLEGVAVPHDSVLVLGVDADGTETKVSLHDHVRSGGRAIFCGKCGTNVFDPGRPGARSTPERMRACRERRVRTRWLADLLRAELAVRRAQGAGRDDDHRRGSGLPRRAPRR